MAYQPTEFPTNHQIQFLNHHPLFEGLQYPRLVFGSSPYELVLHRGARGIPIWPDTKPPPLPAQPISNKYQYRFGIGGLLLHRDFWLATGKLRVNRSHQWKPAAPTQSLWVILNCDAAWETIQGHPIRAAIAFSVRDYVGLFIYGACREVSPRDFVSVTYHELEAIKTAILTHLQLTVGVLRPIIIRSDCKDAIDILQQLNPPVIGSPEATIADEIRALLNEHFKDITVRVDEQGNNIPGRGYRFKFVVRETNFLPDFFASLARGTQLVFYWQNELLNDMVGNTVRLIAGRDMYGPPMIRHP